MGLLAGVLIAAFVLALLIFILVLFVWGAIKDGEEDKAVQKRLGIRRKTRLGR
jgi:hypothetical protein